MEPIIPSLCLLCSLELKKEFLQFPCSHSFCYKCFPYILFTNLETPTQTQNFYNKAPENLIICPTCNNGSLPLPYKDILEFNERTKNNTKDNVCEACDLNSSSNYCIECKTEFCDNCLISIHKPVKKYGDHQIISLDQRNQIQENSQKCSCRIRIMEIYCHVCKIATCKLCFTTYHQNHKNIPLEDFLRDSLSLEASETKEVLYKTIQNYASYKEKLVKQVRSTIERDNDELGVKIDEIIKILMRLKEENREKADAELSFLENQLKLINSSFAYINLEIHNNLHPNKKAQLLKFSFLKQVRDFYVENFQVNHIELDKISKISLILQPEALKMINYKALSEYENFTSNPLSLNEKDSKLLEKSNFYYKYDKSNVSCTFMSNGVSFLVWSTANGSIFSEYRYPLHFYNISTRKKEIIILEENRFPITTLSVYPKDQIEHKYLLSGDDFGVLRVFDLENSQNFQEIQKIETKIVRPSNQQIFSTYGILSAVIFQDKFEEIKENFFILAAFSDAGQPLRIYEVNAYGESGGLIRTIANPVNKLCYTIRYIYDEIQRKTLFFCGFSSSFIKVYQLKENNWSDKQFKTKKDVTAINFLIRNKINEDITNIGNDEINNKIMQRFLIYSQNNNLIVIGNIDSGNIVKEVNLAMVSMVCDIIVWNHNADCFLQNYLLIACKDGNSIMVVNFEDLQEVHHINLKEGYAVNLWKVLLKKGNNQFKECLVSCHYGDGCPMKIYEN